MKRAIPWLVALAVIAAGGFVAWRGLRGHDAPAVQYKTQTVERRKITGRVTASGTLQGRVTVQVGTQVSGRIQKLFKDFNSPVKKGETVAKIDPQLFQAALAQAGASHASAAAGVTRALAQQRDADQILGRTKALRAQGLASQQELDSAETAAAVARANVDVAKAALEQARASLNQAQTNLSFTTIVSPIDGVVIAMMAIGAGAKAQVEAAFAAMGTNLLIVLPGSSTAGGVQGGFGSMPTLTWDDLAAMREEVGTVRWAAPALRSNQSLVAEEANWTTSVTGTSPEYFEIRNWPMSAGDAFTGQDVDTGAKVVVLGQTVVEKLFGSNANPVGQTVRIVRTPFRVIAVAARKGQSATGQDYDDGAFIPFTTFAQKIQGGLHKYVQGSIFVAAVSAEATQRAQADISDLLRDRHHLPPGGEDDFSIRNLSEIAGAQQEGTKTMTTLLASVAAVSLLVGGIGIMNIMLVSVTERTREIGVRMAIGAKPVHILMQFLVEALAMSMAGGLLGVAIGLGSATWLAARFRWPMLVQPEVIGSSVGFSAFVGIVFGLYPARKASRLDPIEALRYE